MGNSGISAILGSVSLLGFLLVILGIGLVVVAASQGRSVRGGILLAIVGLVLGLLFQLASRGVLVVTPTQRAVVFNTLTGDLGNPLSSGTHIIIPVVQEPVIYNINVQNYTMTSVTNEGQVVGDDAVEARTSDGQEVLIDVTILYRINDTESAINTLHRKWYSADLGRPTFETEFVRPTVRAEIRNVTSEYSAEQIYGEARTELAESVEQRLAETFADEGLIVEDFLLRNVTFSEQFTNAIEQAQVAEQDARRAEIRVEQVAQEAQQEIARAEGDRDAAIARAEGEAQSIIIRAQAEAEALRLVSEQIAANPALIQYLYVQNLSDNVNIALVPSNSPFLFDFDSLAQPNTNFVAPDTAPVATPEVEATPSN